MKIKELIKIKKNELNIKRLSKTQSQLLERSLNDFIWWLKIVNKDKTKAKKYAYDTIENGTNEKLLNTKQTEQIKLIFDTCIKSF